MYLAIYNESGVLLKDSNSKYRIRRYVINANCPIEVKKIILKQKFGWRFARNVLA